MALKLSKRLLITATALTATALTATALPATALMLLSAPECTMRASSQRWEAAELGAAATLRESSPP